MEQIHRTLADRRRRPTPMLSRYSLNGRRKNGGRRTGDSQAVYVDRLGRGVSTALLLIFLFHCLDALFTVVQIANGGRELNPFMDALLRVGPGVFVGTKLVIAGVGLSFLGMHKNFPLVKAGIGLLFVLYAGVIGYHFILLWQS